MDKHLGTLLSTSPQPLKLHLDIDYVLHTDTSSLYRATDLARTAVELFQSLVRWSGTHCGMNSEIQRVIMTVSNNSSKQSCLVSTSVTSTLEVNLMLCAI